MNISIVAVGSELLLGQIANTNGQYLSKLLIVLVKCSRTYSYW